MDVILIWDRLCWQFGEWIDICVLGDVVFGIVYVFGFEIEVQGWYLCVRNCCVQDILGDIWMVYCDLIGVMVELEIVIIYLYMFFVI